MAHARAIIGTTNYGVAITAGHHQLNADEGPALSGKDSGPAPFDILCSALRACTAITLRMYAERKELGRSAACKSTCIFPAPARRARSRAS